MRRHDNLFLKRKAAPKTQMQTEGTAEPCHGATQGTPGSEVTSELRKVCRQGGYEGDCACVCVCACMCARVLCVHVFVCALQVHMHTCFVHACVHVHVWMCIRACVHTHVYTRVRVHMRVRAPVADLHFSGTVVQPFSFAWLIWPPHTACLFETKARGQCIQAQEEATLQPMASCDWESLRLTLSLDRTGG